MVLWFCSLAKLVWKDGCSSGWKQEVILSSFPLLPSGTTRRILKMSDSVGLAPIIQSLVCPEPAAVQ